MDQPPIFVSLSLSLSISLCPPQSAACIVVALELTAHSLHWHFQSCLSNCWLCIFLSVSCVVKSSYEFSCKRQSGKGDSNNTLEFFSFRAWFLCWNSDVLLFGLKILLPPKEVRQCGMLQELIVAELGRGSPATIILSSNGDNVPQQQDGWNALEQRGQVGCRTYTSEHFHGQEKKAQGAMLKVVDFELDIAELMYTKFIHKICLEWKNRQLCSRTPRSFAPQGSVVQFASYPPTSNLSLKRGFCRHREFFRVSSSIIVRIGLAHVLSPMVWGIAP